MAELNAVVVLPQPPLPEGTAAGRCAVALLRGLRSHGVRVTALAALPESAPAAVPPADLDVTIVRVPDGDDWSSRLRRVRRPLGTLGHGEFRERVRIVSQSADVVHLETTNAIWANVGPTPAALHVHHLVLRDRELGAPWRKSFFETGELALAERLAAGRYAHLVASSPVVAHQLRAWNRSAEVVVAPLALDPQYYDAAPLDGLRVGIIGTASWEPTARAVRRLVTRIWPMVARAVPDAQLAIAGRGMEALIGRFPGSNGIEVAGEVPSSADFLGGLAVLVYPLERGSGMKVKVLESLASGLPVVTTVDGAEGVMDNPGVIVAQSDGEIAQAVVELLADPAARAERGRSARETFLRLYAPTPATAPLKALFDRMAER